MQPDCRPTNSIHSRFAGLAAWALLSALPGPTIAQEAPAVSNLLAFSGSETSSEVILGPDGRLYGTSLSGVSASSGLIFATTTAGVIEVETVYQMDADDDGGRPEAGLLLASDGLLYGTTIFGPGQFDTSGTVFRVRSDGSDYTVLFEFAEPDFTDALGNVFNSNGAYPTAALIEGSDGNLYGTTRTGGEFGAGTVFRIARNGSGFQTLHVFAEATQDELTQVITNEDGVSPQAALLEGADGYFYGTTFTGGPNGTGTIFRLRFDGTGFEVIHRFSDTEPTDVLLPANEEGAAPLAPLTDGGDGFLYGTASQGGNTGNGTVFAIAPDGSVITALHEFDFADGSRPATGLTLGRDGKLYGTTFSGGTLDEPTLNPVGTIFSIGRDGTGFATLHVFSGIDGANPGGSLLQLSDDVFVGTVENGAQCSQGAVYQFSFSGATIVDGSTDCGPKKKKSGGGSTGLAMLGLIGLLGLSRRMRGHLLDS